MNKLLMGLLGLAILLQIASFAQDRATEPLRSDQGAFRALNKDQGRLVPLDR
jgi:hypothetical protein